MTGLPVFSAPVTAFWPAGALNVPPLISVVALALIPPSPPVLSLPISAAVLKQTQRTAINDALYIFILTSNIQSIVGAASVSVCSTGNRFK